MPFVQRIVSPMNLWPSSGSTVDEGVVDCGRNKGADHVQAALVNCMCQIGDLAKHSESILMQIFTDSLNVADRWQRLERRVEALKTNAETLNANALPITSGGNIARFIEVEKHFASTSSSNKDDFDSESTFVVDTRPRHLAAIYRSIRATSNQRRRPCSTNLIDFEDGSTQTDVVAVNKLQFRTSPSIVVVDIDKSTAAQPPADVVVSRSASPSVDALSFAANVQSESGGLMAAKPLNSTDKTANKSDVDSPRFSPSNVVGVGTTIKVDTTGTSLKRMSALRKSRTTNFSDIPSSDAKFKDFLRLNGQSEERAHNKDNDFVQDRRPAAADGGKKVRRCSRRNTIAVADLKTIEEARNMADSTPAAALTTSLVTAEDEDKTQASNMADEYFYDFAPFYRRRTKRSILSSVNQFFSLRRAPSAKKCDKAKIVNSSTLHDFRQTPPPAPPPLPVQFRTPHKRQTSTPQPDSGIKQFFKRTLSLHLPSTRKGKKSTPNDSNDYLYESLPFRRHRPTVNGYCNSPEIICEDSVLPPPTLRASTTRRGKTHLPISMDSQVLNVAAVLRNNHPTATVNGRFSANKNQKAQTSPSNSRDSAYSSCGKKVRPISIVSFGSLASLDLNDRNSNNGWYRQGYQLEYPDECASAAVNNNNNINGSSKAADTLKISSPRLIVSTVPSASVFASTRRSPHSDVSSVVDSNYSCDQEGYFTSMHRDSGLANFAPTPLNNKQFLFIDSSRSSDFRGRSFSTHSSSSTVAASNGGDEDLVRRSPAASDGMVDSSNESTSSTTMLLRDVCSRRAFPPLCEVSLSESSDNETLKRRNSYRHTLTRSTCLATSTPPPQTPTTPIDAFDQWLLSKFQAEMTMKQINDAAPPPIVGCTMPRRYKEQNNNELLTRDGYNAHKLDPSMIFNNTMPRKSVRFLD